MSMSNETGEQRVGPTTAPAPAQPTTDDLPVLIGPGDPELRRTHMLMIELQVIHDDDPEYLLDLAVAAAKAALRARGRERPGGCGIDIEDQQWWVEDQPVWVKPDQLGGRTLAVKAPRPFSLRSETWKAAPIALPSSAQE